MSNHFMNLKRRSLLQGMGAGALLLSPMLRNLEIEAQNGGTAKSKSRLLLVSLQYGWQATGELDNMIGTGSGANFSFNKALSSFEEIKQHCIIVDGVRGQACGKNHDVSYAELFSAGVPWGVTKSSYNADLATSYVPSIDYLLAQEFGLDPFNDVLRIAVGTYWPWCHSGKDKLIEMFPSGNEAYNKIIGSIRQAALKSTGNMPAPLPTQPTTAELNAQRGRLLLDPIRQDFALLKSRIPNSERNRIQNDLEIYERLLSKAQNSNNNQNTGPISAQCTASTVVSGNFSNDLRSALKLIQAGFVCKTQRIAVLGVGEGMATQNLSWIDEKNMAKKGWNWGSGSDYHHDVAHWIEQVNDQQKAWSKLIGSYYANENGKFIVEFAKNLAATPDPEGGSVLDNTIIMLTGEVSDGQHNTSNKGHILIGGKGLGLKTGQRVVVPTVDQSTLVPYADESGNKIIKPGGGGLQNDKAVVATRHTADLLLAIFKAMRSGVSSVGLNGYNQGALEIT